MTCFTGTKLRKIFLISKYFANYFVKMGIFLRNHYKHYTVAQKKDCIFDAV